jgi:hypothetical protein
MRVNEFGPYRAMRSGLLAVTMIVAAMVVMAGCMSMPGTEATNHDEPGSLEGSDDPALATEQITGVVVGFVGTGLIVENHSAETLKSVVIVVNEGGAEGGFRFRVAEMGPHTTNTYLRQVFRNPEGVSLNPNVTKVRKFALYSDTPTGRGVWRGAY